MAARNAPASAARPATKAVVTKDGRRGLIHLFEWETLFEIVDPETMEPTPSGEVGEMIVTNLSVEGSPVVRFRTGDAARFVAHGDTGSSWGWNAIECGTIIGRFDDMMKIRGNNVWPSAIDAAVFAHTERRRLCRPGLHHRGTARPRSRSGWPWPTRRR